MNNGRTHKRASSIVGFSNRPFGVKHFQTIHPPSVDVARGLVLLFGIGTKALVWSFRCQGVCQAANLCPLVSIFVRSQRPFLRPTSPWSTRGQGWPLHQTLRRAPPLSGHPLTASRATARLRGRDNDQRGARYRARFNRATTLYPVGPKTRTMMQSCASAAKLRSGGPILPVGMKAKGLVGVPPPRTVIGAPSLADKAETIGMPSTFSVYCAGRITTPSGTTPSRTSRHRAISSLRAKATIMGFRVPRAFSVRERNHFVKALSFWCRRNRHAN